MRFYHAAEVARLALRADSIVRDAELLRRLLLPAEGPLSKWTLLGQSFGGFCCVTYLSFAPDGAHPSC